MLLGASTLYTLQLPPFPTHSRTLYLVLLTQTIGSFVVVVGGGGGGGGGRVDAAASALSDLTAFSTTTGGRTVLVNGVG